MEEATAVAIAEEATEQTQAVNDATVEIEQIRADANVEMVEAQAAAAVSIAEAQASEVDEQWLRSEFAAIESRQSATAQTLLDLAGQMQTIASTLSILMQPQAEALEAEVLPPLTAEPETPLDGEAGPRESLAEPGPSAPPKARRRAWM